MSLQRTRGRISQFETPQTFSTSSGFENLQFSQTTATAGAQEEQQIMTPQNTSTACGSGYVQVLQDAQKSGTSSITGENCSQSAQQISVKN